jgi:tRNA nucleotidyltransferase (CCA-adding enzyme)
MNIYFTGTSRLNKSKIPDFVSFIVRRLEGAGFLSFLIGGCVRDIICQKTGKDWDIVTDASPEQIQKVFCDYRALLIGRSFQTITLIMNSQVYHVSTIRCMEKNRGKHLLTEKERYHLLIKDLLCRDFTINSLAWNPDKDILLDPAGGLEDLKRKVIRSSKPALRFREDPLRIIRTVRFACQLNFTINSQTRESITKQALLINQVSPERIREELCLIFEAPEAERGIALLRQYGLEQHILSLDKVKKDMWDGRKREQISYMGLNEFRTDLATQLALWGRLFFGSCRRAQIFYLPLIYHLRFNKGVVKKVKALISREWNTMDYSTGENIRLLLSELGRENVRDMFYLKKILLSQEGNNDTINRLKREEELLQDELRKDLPILLEDLAIKGEDLIRMGIPEGKRIGEILRLLLNRVLISPESNNRGYLFSIVEDMERDSA